ncbi:MAG: hypothetical protein QOI22_1662 [Verrucomicrobiota bacterium]|jgi:hypothetical protein
MNASVLGVLVSLFGFLILFRYGMPFRVRSEGVTYLITEEVDEKEKQIDRRYEVFGYAGLLMALIGGLMQAYGSWH